MNTSLFLAAVILTTSLHVSADEEEIVERRLVSDGAASALRADDFPDLQRQVEEYMTVDRRTKSGAFKIEQFDDGIDEVLKLTGPDAESRYKSLLAKTESWTAKYPSASFAHVLHARVLLAYAYYFRGNGYANTVPPLAWSSYENYLKQAVDILLKSQSVAAQYTGWHATLISVARSLGWPKAAVQKILEDGVARNPNDYRLYHYSLYYYLPKWHGSVEEVDEVISFAERQTFKQHELEIYARLYSAAGESQFKRRLYTDSAVNWEKMRQGLKDWNSHFPTEWNLNIFAYHSCLAQDKAMTKELLNRIGSKPILRIWAPNSEVMFSTCERFAAEP